MKELINAVILTLSLVNLASAAYALHWIIKLLKSDKEDDNNGKNR